MGGGIESRGEQAGVGKTHEQESLLSERQDSILFFFVPKHVASRFSRPSWPMTIALTLPLLPPLQVLPSYCSISEGGNKQENKRSTGDPETGKSCSLVAQVVNRLTN